jgi:DNA-directed RNA polymerase specialized sigma24 family protein
MEVGELEFQNIFNLYQPRIHRYLAHLIGEQEAEDLAQESSVKLIVADYLMGFNRDETDQADR